MPRIAGLMLAIVLPAVLLLRRKRPNERDRADQSNDVPVRMPRGAAIEPASRWRPSEVLRSANFLTIAASFSLGLMVQVGFLTHQVAYLSPRLGTVAAGWAVSLTTFSAIIGRVVIGSFIEKVDCRMAAGGNFCVQIAGMSLLSANASITGLLLGCVLFGLGLGNLITLPGVIVQREFPKQHFARIVSLIVAINQFAFAFGPGLIGYLRQAQGDYAGALRACLAAEAMAAITVMTPPLWRGVARRLGSRRAINELPGRSFSRDRREASTNWDSHLLRRFTARAIELLELGGREASGSMAAPPEPRPRTEPRELLDVAELADAVEEKIALQERRIGGIDQPVSGAVEERAATLPFERLLEPPNGSGMRAVTRS